MTVPTLQPAKTVSFSLTINSLYVSQSFQISQKLVVPDSNVPDGRAIVAREVQAQVSQGHKLGVALDRELVPKSGNILETLKVSDSQSSNDKVPHSLNSERENVQCQTG